MKGPTGTQPTHLTDGEAIQYLDGALEAPDPMAVAGHLRGCPECARRVERVGRRADNLSRMLAEADFGTAGSRRERDVPHARQRPSRPSRTFVRLAAGFAVLFATGLSIRPVRAWVASAIGLTPPTVESTDRGPAPENTESGSTVSFVVGGGTYHIQLDSPQRGGEMVVRVVAGDGPGSVDAGAAGEMPELTIDPGFLRVHNTSGSIGSYSVRLPATIDGLTVGIGDGVARRLWSRGDAVPSTWNLSLSDPR